LELPIKLSIGLTINSTKKKVINFFKKITPESVLHLL
jgi:hypothetical protein